MLNVTDCLRQDADHGQAFIFILLDLSSPFDIIDHLLKDFALLLVYLIQLLTGLIFIFLIVPYLLTI